MEFFFQRNGNYELLYEYSWYESYLLTWHVVYSKKLSIEGHSVTDHKLTSAPKVKDSY